MFLDETQKRYLFNSALAVFILLAVFLGAKTINSLKEYSRIGKGQIGPNSITISGTGKVTAVPDVATFSFSVVEKAKTVSDAQNAASKKNNDIVTALKAMGIDEKDIQTTGYNVYPKYEYTKTGCSEPLSASGTGAVGISSYPCYNSKQTLTGYEVDQTNTVKVRKTADAGDVLTKVGSLGATNVSGLNFVIDNPEKVQAEARDKAIADAKAKAATLSKSLGVKLDKVMNFYESAGPWPLGYDGPSMKSALGAGATVAPEIQPGQNTVTSNVSITYEID